MMKSEIFSTKISIFIARGLEVRGDGNKSVIDGVAGSNLLMVKIEADDGESFLGMSV
jgi:hypothetical protein